MNSKQKQTETISQSKVEAEKKAIELKPITQRIAEYKRESMKRQQQQAVKYHRKLRQVNVEEISNKIQNNASKLLQQMKQQKIKKDQQRKIIQAKIRALQLKSLQKLKHCKKEPFQGGESFDLGDSQYSTFSARANNRKLQKKKKKQKPKVSKQVEQDDLKKRTSNFLRKSSKNTKRSSTQKLKTQQIVLESQTIKQNPQGQKEIKGPFFIWNIPVYQHELQKIQNSNDKVFMNIERLNQKSGKTFRQQANQFLTQKMENKMINQRQKVRQHNFMIEVEAKKQELLKAFEKEQKLRAIQEPFWNEDQVFKPSKLQNFHFHTKVSST